MGKKLEMIILAAVLLLSLPLLFVFINGAVLGTFEMFPTQERIAQVRPIYLLIVAFLLFGDVMVLIRFIRLARSK